MVVSTEPMISISGAGGFRYADMLLITEEEIELFTKFDNGLIIKP